MKNYFKILLFMGMTIFPYATYAQNQSYRLLDLKGREWYMVGPTDKTNIAYYEDSLIIYTLIDTSKSIYKFSFEYYLSDSIDYVFDSTKVGKIRSGNYIITRILKNSKFNPDQPRPVSVFQIISLNSSTLLIRNIQQQNFLEYNTK